MRRGGRAGSRTGHDRQGLCGAGAGVAPGPDLVKALQEHVKAEIAPYKYPRAIEFVDSLPRTETGKLQRFVLRQKAAGG